LQIEGKGQKTPVQAGSTVIVREHRNGSMTLLLNRQKLRWHELAERPKKLPPIPKRRLCSGRGRHRSIHGGSRCWLRGKCREYLRGIPTAAWSLLC
jgi:hypothetical protein